MVNIRKQKNALKFDKPAGWWGSVWREALPTGNGVIGAAVCGGASHEVIMINHGDLWWQGHVGVMQDVADKLGAVRKKLDDNAASEAQGILSSALITKGYRPTMSYPLPLCDFRVDMRLEKQAKDYRRIINMENGEVSVVYKDGTTKYERSVFVSRAKNIVCYEITKSGKNSIDATFSLSLHDKFNARTPVSISKLPEGVNVKYENFFMYFSARSDNGTEFGAVAKVTFFGGSQQVDAQRGITVKGAEKILVLICPFIESQREKEWKELRAKLAAEKLPYIKLIKEHTALHSKLFGAADIDFEATDREASVDELSAKNFTEGELPLALAEKLWAYGRYLFICGTSPSSQPVSPYGLWCGDYKAPDSNIDASGQLQTCYEQSLAGNLGEYVTALHTYYSTVLADLKKNSSRIYGCRGILIPPVIAHGTGALGSVDPAAIHFTGAAGWISRLFYDYYLFSGDEKFLKEKAMPFMKDVATFYEEFLQLDGGAYKSSPSLSPNDVYGDAAQKIAKNATADFAIIRELLTNLIQGSSVTGLYKEERAKWKKMLSHLPGYMYNGDGTVKEYCDAAFADNETSPSTAMFYPVFPSVTASQELTKAYSLTAKKKLSSAREEFTSGTLSTYANILARTGDGDGAYDLLSRIVRGMCMQNLVCTRSDWRGMGIGKQELWASYSIEGNLGMTNALQEMLLQSKEGYISLLPALPQAVWRGEADGFLTRAGVEVSLTWNAKKHTASAKLKSRKTSTVTVQLPSGAVYRIGKGGETFNAEQCVIEGLKLPSNKTVIIEFRI